jgi:hypothetical protein
MASLSNQGIKGASFIRGLSRAFFRLGDGSSVIKFRLDFIDFVQYPFYWKGKDLVSKPAQCWYTLLHHSTPLVTKETDM